MGGVDSEPDNLAQHIGRRLDVHRLHVWAAPDQLPRVAPRPFQQYRHFGADGGGIESPLPGIEPVLERG